MQSITRTEFLSLPQVAFVASGHDLAPASYIFVNMPSLDTLRDEERWTHEADYVLDDIIQRKEITRLWPDSFVVDYHCTCCGGGGDLVEAETCSSCESIFGHSDDCLWGLPAGSELFGDAYRLWRIGYDQGQSGRKCTQRTLHGRRGYRVGRKDRKAERARRLARF